MRLQGRCLLMWPAGTKGLEVLLLLAELLVMPLVRSVRKPRTLLQEAPLPYSGRTESFCSLMGLGFIFLPDYVCWLESTWVES